MDEKATGTLEKGLRILRILSTSAEGMTVSELSGALGYPVSTMSRLLRTLREEDYVWQASRRGVYKLGYDILELAGNLLKNMEVREAARPYLSQLATTTGLIAQLKVPSGVEVVSVDAVIPPMVSTLESHMGTRMFMHVSILGKAILAFREKAEVQSYIERVEPIAPEDRRIEDPTSFLGELQRIRESGYSIRYNPDGTFNSLAAPIFRFDGRPVAALGAGAGFGFTPFLPALPQDIQRIAHEVMTAAKQTSFALGYRADRLAG